MTSSSDFCPPVRIMGFQVSWDGMKERHAAVAAEFREAFPKVREVVAVTRESIDLFLQGQSI